MEGVDGVGAGAKVAWADLCCPKKEWVLVWNEWKTGIRFPWFDETVLQLL